MYVYIYIYIYICICRTPLDFRDSSRDKDIRFIHSELLGDNQPALELWKHYSVSVSEFIYIYIYIYAQIA